MSNKDPKNPKNTSAQNQPGFQEPATSGSQQSDALGSEEEARTEEFEPPKRLRVLGGCSIHSAESALAGVSEIYWNQSANPKRGKADAITGDSGRSRIPGKPNIGCSRAWRG